MLFKKASEWLPEIWHALRRLQETEFNGFLMLRVTQCYVQESCPNHVCVQVKPVYPAAAPSGNTSKSF
jgi:hypothetical protein